MKKVTLLLSISLCWLTASAQDSLQLTPMYNGTFYDIAIRDTSHVLANVLYYVEIGQPLRVDLTQENQGYVPVENGGWAALSCISRNAPTAQEVEAMRQAFLNGSPKSAPANSGTTDPCAEADKWKNRHAKSGSAVDLDNYRKWFARCLDKEY